MNTATCPLNQENSQPSPCFGESTWNNDTPSAREKGLSGFWRATFGHIRTPSAQPYPPQDENANILHATRRFQYANRSHLSSQVGSRSLDGRPRGSRPFQFSLCFLARRVRDAGTRTPSLQSSEPLYTSTAHAHEDIDCKTSHLRLDFFLHRRPRPRDHRVRTTRSKNKLKKKII